MSEGVRVWVSEGVSEQGREGGKEERVQSTVHL